MHALLETLTPFVRILRYLIAWAGVATLLLMVPLLAYAFYTWMSPTGFEQYVSVGLVIILIGGGGLGIMSLAALAFHDAIVPHSD